MCSASTARLLANVLLLASAAYGGWYLASSPSGFATSASSALNLKPLSVSGRAVNGRLRAVGAEGFPTLYMAFSPSCPISHAAAPSWRALLSAPELRGRPVVGIAPQIDRPGDVLAFLRKHQLNLPTYSVRFAEFSAATGASMVPSVIIADRDGKVLYLKEGGMLDEETRRSILTYFAR